MQERSRSPALSPIPADHVGDRAAAKGLAVVGDEGGIRCPHCNKRLGDSVIGIYKTTCPKCKRPVRITG